MKRTSRILALLLMLSLVLSLAACSNATSSIAYTFKVDSGDDIKVTMDTTDKYGLTSDVPFAVTHKDEVVAQGAFAYADAYNMYHTAIEETEGAELLEESSRDDCKYFFYTITSEEATEHNYIISVTGSETCILLGSLKGEEAAREVFNRLTFSQE